ncbi:phosphoenolpyruvate synthase [Rubrobacter tropicus]|uniref:Phosphoenolpyruvate synthase n=1 Tax=Rubrobacter tropicus TaxID=2653851 RepID=A0A6G8Q5G7_9ACTN|nr:PEP/pyruvate-binding domain-containing protein [Rubrobacter tropicus]QIN81700.1 phosphoenolpyruvate synthase [Rubrobacter tropicus]
MERAREVPVVPLTLDFVDVDRTMLPAVGGKAANLGEMIRAGLPVPGGFCVTTAAYDLVAAGAGLDGTLAALAETTPEDAARLAELAEVARFALLEAPVPDELVREISANYEGLGDDAPVAVRSSATAEDLPQASFAGQQDTYLNVIGPEAVLDAVRRCWASLWTERAVSYRATNGIDPRAVRLAVVVQRMVAAEVSGILFTANPITGRRRQAVIDASVGLGEAIVSGAVNPDHFVVDTATGRILERRPGDKRIAVVAEEGGGTRRIEGFGGGEEASLTDEQVRALARLGARVEEHYGAPQDTEWAIDAGGTTWLLQARPITTLFPLPACAPDDELRVYFSASVAQGVYQPLTPMGRQAFRLLGSSISTLLGYGPPDPFAGPAPYAEAAGRLFVDVTPALRSTFGRGLLDLATRNMEARTAPILRHLADDPRLSPTTTSPWPAIRAVLPTLLRVGVPQRLILALLHPAKARNRALELAADFRAADDVSPTTVARLDEAGRILLSGPPRLLPDVPPAFGAGLVASALAGRLLGGLATGDERRVALRALPHNPTTEMDLALWDLAQRVRADPDAAGATRDTPSPELARNYQDGALPGTLQEGLARFLGVYGHRAVAEIDLGLPRWSENPTHVLGVISNYLRLEDPARAPDIQFRRAALEAEAMVEELSRRAYRRGRLRGRLVAFFLNRARALLGMREMPKFCIILLFARVRSLLLPVGRELAEAGRLEDADDVFFLTLPEARAAAAGEDLRELVRERRADHDRETRRRHIPRVLLSDGTEPDAGVPGKTTGDLNGTPASGGVAVGAARVVLDPAGAGLEPGEILVAPSTDPGWTPLFLTAGGLVMEMGGPMSHGAIVAREYGIPAVVGVPDATGRIITGQEVTVDGSLGTITLGKPAEVQS